MGKSEWFFEEDPAAANNHESELTWSEHADTFVSTLKSEGIAQDLSLEPMAASVEMATDHIQNGVMDIEFGTVREDYVFHVTPKHPQKNLSKQAQFNPALREFVIAINKVVPTTLKVDIFLPRSDYEIKATSFIIRGGATAWNLDHSALEKQVAPELLAIGTTYCMKA